MSECAFRDNDWLTVGRQGAPVIQMTGQEAPVTGDPKSRASAAEATRVYDVKLYFPSVP